MNQSPNNLYHDLSFNSNEISDFGEHNDSSLNLENFQSEIPQHYSFENTHENLSNPEQLSDRGLVVLHQREVDNEIISDEYVTMKRIENVQELQCVIDEVKCQICLSLLMEPVACISCEAPFCFMCILKWFDECQLLSCPSCRVRSDQYLNSNPYAERRGGLLFSDNQPTIFSKRIPCVLRKILSKVVLTCKNKIKGCQARIPYENLNSHQDIHCGYLKVKCKLAGCKEIIDQKDLAKHEVICRYALVQCNYCHLQIQKMDQSHAFTCLNRPQDCRWCGKLTQIDELERHQDQCEERWIPCASCNRWFHKSLKHQLDHCLKQQLAQSRQNESRCYEMMIRMQSELELVQKENLLLRGENQKFKQIQSQRNVEGPDLGVVDDQSIIFGSQGYNAYVVNDASVVDEEEQLQIHIEKMLAEQHRRINIESTFQFPPINKCDQLELDLFLSDIQQRRDVELKSESFVDEYVFEYASQLTILQRQAHASSFDLSCFIKKLSLSFLVIVGQQIPQRQNQDLISFSDFLDAQIAQQPIASTSDLSSFTNQFTNNFQFYSTIVKCNFPNLLDMLLQE